MTPARANELLAAAQVAIADAHVSGLSPWTRLSATYDAAVCVAAVLADAEIPPTVERDDALEKLLGWVRLEPETTEDLQVLARCFRVDARGSQVIAHAHVDRALARVEQMLSDARSQRDRA